MKNSIALLATGSELLSGDTLNTNSQRIAQQLTDRQLIVGQHLTVSDDEDEMVAALEFLFQQHRCVITTGGLGPTSDDRTRFAVARAFDTTLQFHEPSWQSIVDRLHKMHLAVPESNRQQALFPEHATVLPNPNGTAAGCFTQQAGKLLYMLPGPPGECLPLFEQHVLPSLCQHLAVEQGERLRWRSFGVSEGTMAEAIDTACRDFACETAYRIFYPYLDIKIHLQDVAQKAALLRCVEPLITPHVICDTDKTAIQMLNDFILASSASIQIIDKACGGALEQNLRSADNFAQLFFGESKRDTDYLFEIKGLQHYWEQQTEAETALSLRFSQQGKLIAETQHRLPFRNHRVRYAAAELCAYQILDWLKTNA